MAVSNIQCLTFSFVLVLTRDTLACLADSNLLAGKRCIVVGAKSDLARTRVVTPSDGCSLAMAQGVKFTEISAGVGCKVHEYS